MPNSGFAAIQLRCINQAMKQLLILLSRVGWSLSSAQKWKKKLIIRTDAQISKKCNNHQLQVALGRAGITGISSTVVGYNVLSLNVENHIWGDPLKQAGPEIDRESPIEKINFLLLFSCFNSLVNTSAEM